MQCRQLEEMAPTSTNTESIIAYLIVQSELKNESKKVNKITITKSKRLYDYREFVRDENNNLVHKSKIKNNNHKIESETK